MASTVPPVKDATVASARAASRVRRVSGRTNRVKVDLNVSPSPVVMAPKTEGDVAYQTPHSTDVSTERKGRPPFRNRLRKC
ncbi:hypothetical protein acdb102_05300 [Acidothermaceae bacterium B102]|nr:hypothetical protein acdb102_05300 [Acidothermaceae bacterium B102]